MNEKRLVDICYVLAGLFTAYILWNVIGLAWDYFRLPVWEDFPMGVPALLAIAGGIGVSFAVKNNEISSNYLKDVVVELSKVTWPVRTETVQASVAVLVMIAVASFILTIIDGAWGWIFRKVFIL